MHSSAFKLIWFKHKSDDLVLDPKYWLGKGKNFCSNYLRKFSMDTIWCAVDMCWSDGPHYHSKLSDQYSRQRTLLRRLHKKNFSTSCNMSSPYCSLLSHNIISPMMFWSSISSYTPIISPMMFWSSISSYTPILSPMMFWSSISSYTPIISPMMFWSSISSYTPIISPMMFWSSISSYTPIISPMMFWSSISSYTPILSPMMFWSSI